MKIRQPEIKTGGCESPADGMKLKEFTELVAPTKESTTTALFS
jgi:hypothetical protein